MARRDPEDERHKLGPDEAELLIWSLADTVERLRKRCGAPMARQAARAGLEVVRQFEQEYARANSAGRGREAA